MKMSNYPAKYEVLAFNPGHESITNDILRPSNSKIYGKEPRYNETSL